jgi:hypothetical protein
MRHGAHGRSARARHGQKFNKNERAPKEYNKTTKMKTAATDLVGGFFLCGTVPAKWSTAGGAPANLLPTLF